MLHFSVFPSDHESNYKMHQYVTRFRYVMEMVKHNTWGELKNDSEMLNEFKYPSLGNSEVEVRTYLYR